MISSNYNSKDHGTSRSCQIKNTREREREFKHIATGTYPQPRGWTTPSSSWRAPGWWRWPPVRDPPYGRVPEQGPDWFLVATEARGCGTPDLLCSPMFLGYMDIYIGERSRSGEPTRVGRAPRGVGRASLPCGLLASFLTSTPSPLDHVCSKNNSPEGFFPFDIRFLRNTEIGKKTAIWAGPPVNRLVPKIM